MTPAWMGWDKRKGVENELPAGWAQACALSEPTQPQEPLGRSPPPPPSISTSQGHTLETSPGERKRPWETLVNESGLTLRPAEKFRKRGRLPEPPLLSVPRKGHAQGMIIIWNIRR